MDAQLLTYSEHSITMVIICVHSLKNVIKEHVNYDPACVRMCTDRAGQCKVFSRHSRVPAGSHGPSEVPTEGLHACTAASFVFKGLVWRSMGVHSLFFLSP